MRSPMVAKLHVWRHPLVTAVVVAAVAVIPVTLEAAIAKKWRERRESATIWLWYCGEGPILGPFNIYRLTQQTVFRKFRAEKNTHICLICFYLCQFLSLRKTFGSKMTV